MTEHDITVARDMGELKADVRTIKHDVSNIQMSITGINNRLNSLSTQHARGLGFFAGAAFIITAAGGLLLTVAKLMFGGNP